MRITAYITTSGDRTLTRMLTVGMKGLSDISPDGKFDEVVALKMLADVPGIVGASDDCRPVYAFVIQAIDYSHKMLKQLADRPGSSDKAECRQDERCERKMDDGKCAFARMDVKWRDGGIRVRISGGNPLGLVGSVDIQVRETCVFFAYVCQCIIESVSDGVKIEVVEGENAEGVVEEAKRKRIEADLWKKGETCDRRHGGYCSPSDPSCGNYDCGLCKWHQR